MLKRDSMAIKFAKTVISTVVEDSKDNTLKDNVTKALEQAYQTGYDLAAELCDNRTTQPKQSAAGLRPPRSIAATRGWPRRSSPRRVGV